MCRTTFGGSQTIVPSPNRDLHFVNFQSPSSQLWLDEFNWYSSSLTGLQITRLISEREGVDQSSKLSAAALLSARVTCALTASRVMLFEDGVLKIDRELVVSDGSGTAPVQFAVSQSAGHAVGFQLSNIRAVEVLSARGVPSFCPGTGHFYAVVNAAGVTAGSAAAAAAQLTHLGQAGHLATLSSAAEQECVAALANCDTVWVSGQSGSPAAGGDGWMFAHGPESGSPIQSFFQADATASAWYASEFWAGGAPDAAAGAYLAMNRNECKTPDSAQGGLFACDQACTSQTVVGYVVEFPTPPAHVTEHASLAAGATIAVVSSETSVTCASVVPSCDEGKAVGRANLLRADPVAYLTNGEVHFMFSDAAVTAPSWVVVDLGSDKAVNRAGAVTPQGDRPVTDFVAAFVGPSVSGPWAALGQVGADDGVRDVWHSESWFAAQTPVTARFVRFEFGARAAGALAPRVARLHVQLVEATFSRLLVDGVDVSPRGAGLNAVALAPGSTTVHAATSFPLDTESSLNAFAGWVDDLPAGSVVLGAVSDMPAPTSLLFRETFSSSISNNDVNRQIVEVDGAGVLQLKPGLSYSGAVAHCANVGARLCERELICRPKWVSYTRGYPHYGWNSDGAAYVPAGDRDNLWIAVGKAFLREDLCGSYDELHGGVDPDDDTTERWTSTVVMCCKRDPDVPNWVTHHEGIMNTTGGSPGTDNNYPGVWRISNSRLWIFGYPHGNPERPGWNGVNAARWWYERCQTVIGGTYVALEDAVALQWDDYSFSFDVYPATRGVGMLVRYQNPDNYIRVFVDPEGDCHHIVRRRHGEYTTLWAVTEWPFDVRQWFRFKVTVSGPRVLFYVNSELWADVTDTHPDPLLVGSVAVYDWMGYNDYYDNLIVETASLWSDASNATAALKALGASSYTGIDEGSWAMVGRKGAQQSAVPVQADRSGTPVRVQSLFQCPVQRRRVPENSPAGFALPLPLMASAGASADSFTVRVPSGGTASDVPLAVDRVTGHLLVASSAVLDAETAGTVHVQVSARSAGFDSGWFPFGAQADTLSFRELHHGQATEPSALDVSVTIRAVDGPNKGFQFKGTGNVFMTDASHVFRYGGLVFGYSADSVRLWAPSAYQRRPSGNIINIGSGWGGVFEEGVFLREANAQRSQLADVRVQVHPGSTPDFDSGWLPMRAESGSASFMSVSHNLNSVPDRVRVQVKATDGLNSGFVFEGG